jgi:hypothetical protein
MQQTLNTKKEIQMKSKKINMIARIYTKPQVQGMLKALRQAGVFTIEKTGMGYEVKHTKSDIIVFKAMNGSRAYLVRHADNLFA